ncbi:hypothetical protein BD310DRAFT_1026333 [Dichomitus squalens]|uniref:Uncharacterized protein n=1 Tax=Dichomitus squalens TaxID=114155 RepID=A0A4Q9PP32_9APHY|nr:hypothetical protein BD310DRAFT_1026333 [Dichomitus squalens]
MSMHLGWVYTECFLRDPLQDSPILGYLQIFFLKLTFRTPTEEAHASVYAAVLPDVGRGEIASRVRAWDLLDGSLLHNTLRQRANL